MKRRLISLLLTVAMVVSVCCVFASAAPAEPAHRPDYRYDYYRYYDYYKFTADVDVDATGLVCKNEVGNTTTAYVPKTTVKAYIDVDTTGKCSVNVKDSDHAVKYCSGKYEITLDEGWNTVTVTVTADKYYYNPALYYWMYHAPVANSVEDGGTATPPGEGTQNGSGKDSATSETDKGKDDGYADSTDKSDETKSLELAPQKPAPQKPEPAPQKPVYVKWYPRYSASDVTKTFTVKIYRGDVETCSHVACKYVGCGKHDCKLHVSCDLGTVSSDTHKITVITSEGGGVSSADQKYTDNKVVRSFVVDVVDGSGTKVNVVPNAGYTIGKMTVDGVEVTPALVYTFSDVNADHTLAVTFVKY